MSFHHVSDHMVYEFPIDDYPGQEGYDGGAVLAYLVGRLSARVEPENSASTNGGEITNLRAAPDGTITFDLFDARHVIRVNAVAIQAGSGPHVDHCDYRIYPKEDPKLLQQFISQVCKEDHQRLAEYGIYEEDQS